MEPVRVIQPEGEALLVEWNEQRLVVPSEALEGDQIARDVLQAGIEYGEPWDETVTVNVTRAKLQEALRERGVWTFQDVLRNPAQVTAVFRHAMDEDLQRLFLLAKEKHND